jgi:hypothetical protein
LKAAINTIRNHAEAIRDAIDMFALNGEIEECSMQIDASIREIQAKLKYMEIRAEEIKKMHK